MNRHLTGIVAGCCLLLTPTVLPAAAGEGIQLGPALLFPALGISETYDDNIGRSSDSLKQEDWVTKISPALRLALPVERYFLEVEGGLSVIRFKDHSSENSTDWFLGASTGGDFPGGLSFKIGDTHAERYLVGSQEYGPGEKSAQNTLRATVSYAIRNALRLEVSGHRQVYTFDRSAARERVEAAVQADVYWKFRPSLSALVEAGFTDYSYDSNARQDGSATRAALGLTWEITQKSTGVAKAGYQAKRYKTEDAALGIEAVDHYILSVALGHYLTRRTKVDIDLSHSSQESDFVENPYYLRTAFGVALGQRFTPKLYARAGIRYSRDDYPNAAVYANPYDPASVPEQGERSDKNLSANISAGFDATRWLALELAYEVERRDSNFDTFDYKASRVSLSAKAAF